MSNNLIKPEQKFGVQINLEVKVSNVCGWSNLGTQVAVGGIKKLVEKAIFEDLVYGEGFKVDLSKLDGTPMFDSFNFSVVGGE